jgi:hypothetical protein
MKQFLRYCWGIFTHPRTTFDALAAEKSVRWGFAAAFLGTFEVWGNIALNAIFGYDWLGTRGILTDPTLVGGFGHWRVNLSEYLPVLVILMPIMALMGLCVTCGIAQLMSKIWRGQGTFEQMVNALSFAAVPAVVIATVTEWIFGVPIALLTGERYWWTDAMAGKFGIVSIIWNIYFWGVYITLQYVATLTLGSMAIRRIQKIPAWAAVVTMVTAFVFTMFLDSFIIR